MGWEYACLTASYFILIQTTSAHVIAIQSAPLLPAKSVAVMEHVLTISSSTRYPVSLTPSSSHLEIALLSLAPLATIAKLPPRNVFLVILLALTVEALFPLTVTPVLMALPFLSKIQRKEDVWLKFLTLRSTSSLLIITNLFSLIKMAQVPYLILRELVRHNYPSLT